MSQESETSTIHSADVENHAADLQSNKEDLSNNEVEVLKDQLLRALADLENTRKRAAKEVHEASTYGVTKFARDLIEVLENLYRAESAFAEITSSEPSISSLQQGVSLTRKSLEDVFTKYKIERIDPINQPFNHDFHQAIAQIPASAEHLAGHVIQVTQAGYIIADRLLRPALVVVAKN